MVSSFELIFFGIFILLLWRYVLPRVLKYIQTYQNIKKEEYRSLLDEERKIKKKVEQIEGTYREKSSELNSLINDLDFIFEKNLSDFRKINETQTQLYKKNEQNKLNSEISKIQNEIIDSCVQMLENEVYSKLKNKNIICFEIAIKEIKELLKKS